MYTLLIVDDENIIRSGLRIMIDDFNLPLSAIIEAENGFKALEVINNYNIDIILLDIKMPKMDGLFFLKELRA